MYGNDWSYESSGEWRVTSGERSEGGRGICLFLASWSLVTDR